MDIKTQIFKTLNQRLRSLGLNGKQLKLKYDAISKRCDLELDKQAFTQLSKLDNILVVQLLTGKVKSALKANNKPKAIIQVVLITIDLELESIRFACEYTEDKKTDYLTFKM